MDFVGVLINLNNELSDIVESSEKQSLNGQAKNNLSLFIWFCLLVLFIFGGMVFSIQIEDSNLILSYNTVPVLLLILCNILLFLVLSLGLSKFIITSYMEETFLIDINSSFVKESSNNNNFFTKIIGILFSIPLLSIMDILLTDTYLNLSLVLPIRYIIELLAQDDPSAFFAGFYGSPSGNITFFEFYLIIRNALVFLSYAIIYLITFVIIMFLPWSFIPDETSSLRDLIIILPLVYVLIIPLILLWIWNIVQLLIAGQFSIDAIFNIMQTVSMDFDDPESGFIYLIIHAMFFVPVVIPFIVVGISEGYAIVTTLRTFSEQMKKSSRKSLKSYLLLIVPFGVFLVLMAIWSSLVYTNFRQVWIFLIEVVGLNLPQFTFPTILALLYENFVEPFSNWFSEVFIPLSDFPSLFLLMYTILNAIFSFFAIIPVLKWIFSKKMKQSESYTYDKKVDYGYYIPFLVFSTILLVFYNLLSFIYESNEYFRISDTTNEQMVLLSEVSIFFSEIAPTLANLQMPLFICGMIGAVVALWRHFNTKR